jgi:hypothetical protein
LAYNHGEVNLRDKHRLTVFENGKLYRILGPQGDEITEHREN